MVFGFGWIQKRRERKEAAKMAEVIQAVILDYIGREGAEAGIDGLMTVPIFEEVEWDKGRQSWAVVVLEGGASYEAGSVSGGEKLSRGQRVSMMQGRGGRIEDAVVVSGRKVDGSYGRGYMYLLDFKKTGGAEPWFRKLIK